MSSSFTSNDGQGQRLPVTPLGSGAAYALIAIIWLLARAYSFSQTVPSVFWEIWEARKLLDYGFFARHGGIIDCHFMTGILADPEKFNYVNHPYPVLWIFTLFYHLFGEWGALAWASLLGLASSLAAYPALKTRFSSGQALFGTLLLVVAPTTIIMSVNPNIVALGAIGWPFVVLCLAKYHEPFSWKKFLFLAAVIFLLGQISWFTYTISTAVILVLFVQMIISSGWTASWWRSPVFPIVLGSVATVAVLVLQICYYTYDLPGVLQYIHGQAGSEASVPLPRMYFGIGFRLLLSIGPALLAGGLVGFLSMRKNPAKHWLDAIALAYVFIFLGALLLLPRFFFREITMYEYLVFPLTVATLRAVETVRLRIFAPALAVLALVTIGYPLFQASIPLVSETSRAVAAALASNTGKEEILATNIENQKFPFEAWDVGSVNNSSMLSDRLVMWGIGSLSQLNGVPANLKSASCPVTFVFCSQLPAEKDLQEVLAGAQPFKKVHVDLPVEPVSAATRIRNIYWKIVGKHQVEPAHANEGPKGIDLCFYHLNVKN